MAKLSPEGLILALAHLGRNEDDYNKHFSLPKDAMSRKLKLSLEEVVRREHEIEEQATLFKELCAMIQESQIVGDDGRGSENGGQVEL